jgi:hypothetical protein
MPSGWWFDACGPSNLNGMYYSHGQNMGKLNGIRWHYFKGSSYSLRATTMMIRPADFWEDLLVTVVGYVVHRHIGIISHVSIQMFLCDKVKYCPTGVTETQNRRWDNCLYFDLKNSNLILFSMRNLDSDFLVLTCPLERHWLFETVCLSTSSAMNQTVEVGYMKRIWM